MDNSRSAHLCTPTTLAAAVTRSCFAGSRHSFGSCGEAILRSLCSNAKKLVVRRQHSGGEYRPTPIKAFQAQQSSLLHTNKQILFAVVPFQRMSHARTHARTHASFSGLSGRGGSRAPHLFRFPYSPGKYFSRCGAARPLYPCAPAL